MCVYTHSLTRSYALCLTWSMCGAPRLSLPLYMEKVNEKECVNDVVYMCILRAQHGMCIQFTLLYMWHNARTSCLPLSATPYRTIASF